MDVDRLLRLNARPMLQLADFVLSDPSAAEDAVEHSFVSAWRQRKGLKDEAAFRPWLRRIVLRECLGWRRHPREGQKAAVAAWNSKWALRMT